VGYSILGDCTVNKKLFSSVFLLIIMICGFALADTTSFSTVSARIKPASYACVVSCVVFSFVS
jgi:hypothetical protein